MNIVCQNHPRYKGSTPIGKRNANCQLCQALRKKFENEKIEKHKRERIYTSISTREAKVSFDFLMAEILTLIKFGYQYPNFWSVDSISSEEEKIFFKKALAQVSLWKKYKSWAMESLIALLNRVLDEGPKQVIIQEPAVKEQNTEAPKDNIVIVKDGIKFNREKTPFEKMRDL